jgi:hypothetical protein
MDGEAWDFLRSMLEKATKMPGLRIRPARVLFGVPEAAAGGEVRG